jgi:hypothetical protein
VAGGITTNFHPYGGPAEQTGPVRRLLASPGADIDVLTPPIVYQDGP